MFRYHFIVLFFLGSINFCHGQNNKSTYSGAVVVELFTSQGDINSPGADNLLKEIAIDAEKNNKPVYCISLHVDFWNRFGWKDPFSSLKYTNRLQNYSSAFGDKETYTPRFIINGKSLASSPNDKVVASTIQKELSSPSKFNPDFTYQIFDDTLDISLKLTEDLSKSKFGSLNYVNVVIFEKENTTKVTKGDNAGKTLTNRNVSRLFYTTDLKSTSQLIRIPLKKLKPGPGKSILLFIQDKKSKVVGGATVTPFETANK